MGVVKKLPQIILLIITTWFAWVVFNRRSELYDIFETFIAGDWRWIFAALLAQLVYLLVFTKVYQQCFSLLKIEIPFKNLFAVMFASIFANLAPTGGTTGAALFINEAARRNNSVARASIGALLVQITDYIIFMFIVFFGAANLFFANTLRSYQIIAVILLIIFIFLMVMTLFLSNWNQRLAEKFLKIVQNIINKFANIFTKHDSLQSKWYLQTTAELQNASQTIVKSPKRVSVILLTSIFTHGANIATLLFLFLAFNEDIAFGILISGYSFSFLFSEISITPQGIGVVEGVMILVFVSLGFTVEKATLVSLGFRGLNLWLPLFIGFIIFRRLKMFENKTNIK